LSNPPTTPDSLLPETLAACRVAFAWLALFSASINVLMLTAPLFMLQVFDRVLTSRSVDTLIVLASLAAFALLAMAALEAVRGFALLRVGEWVDGKLGKPVLRAQVRASVRGQLERPLDGLRDIANLRSFVAGAQMFPIMDAPWTPLFLVVVFLLHPLLGWLATAGAIVLLVLACLNELATRRPLARAAEAQATALSQADSAVRNADAITAMGMLRAVTDRWQQQNEAAFGMQAGASARANIIAAMSKLVRLGLQIGVLGTAAWLVIRGQLTPGGMIASSILMGRALAPVDQAIGSWKAFVSARAAYRRVAKLLEAQPEPPAMMSLPAPTGAIAFEEVAFLHGETPVLRNLSFTLAAGSALGIIGPTGSGKTTLARLLVGNLAATAGHVRLDGVDVSQWDADERGPHIGYLPQNVELFIGSVRENIARMGEPDAEAVIEAARKAGVHEVILRLPDAYDAEVGDGGARLSGGQRQRIALARALYGNPALVVLDEPTASLDQPGVDALLHAVRELKERGATLVLIAHQPNIVKLVDYLLVLRDGVIQLAGPRDDVLAQVTDGAASNSPSQPGTGPNTGSSSKPGRGSQSTPGLSPEPGAKPIVGSRRTPNPSSVVGKRS
jgi:PrtD family type I secretion system ABC transporter